jgi:ATP-dependent exoDNAse (exonuclease V) alpha subunit
VIQGIAGAGKSTMLQAVARRGSRGPRCHGPCLPEQDGRRSRGRGGIKSQTIASFILANERHVQAGGPAYDEARAALAGSMLIVDETSMVSSDDMLTLHQIAAALGVDKLVFVGDRQQLSSIDAGKSFALIQAGGGTMARMDENIRQRTDQLRTVAALANLGEASKAMKVLGESVVEHQSPALHAAEMWLGLSAADREATAVFASGRAARAVINQRIQDGLATEGSVRGEGIHLTVYERVNTTREELRYVATYQAGQTLEVGRGGGQDVGLAAGRYDVARVHPNGKVDLKLGNRSIRFDPQKLSPTEKRDRLQLSEKKDLHLREGDRIRWTANDKERGLHNSALARVLAVDAEGVTVETAGKERLTLDLGDPMLSRLDLAYSLNMHMAQGITTDKAITVMSSQERNLSNQRLFNVGVTRVRDELTMVVDDKEKLERQLDNNPGNKSSALETVGRLDVDHERTRGKSSGPREKLHVGPVDLADLPPLPGELPSPAHTQGAAAAAGASSHRPTSSRTVATLCRRCRNGAWGSTCEDRPAGRRSLMMDDLPRDFHPALIRASAIVVMPFGGLFAMGSGMPDPIAKIVSA